MCDLDNWKNMQTSRGLLRFTGSSLVFSFPRFPFYIKCLVFPRQHGHPWKLSHQSSLETTKKKKPIQVTLSLEEHFFFPSLVLLFFLPKWILMFAYVKLQRIKWKGAIWLNLTRVDIKNHNLTGNRQQQPNESFILSAELTLTLWLSFFSISHLSPLLCTSYFRLICLCSLVILF